MRINVDKQFMTAYPRDERFGGIYDNSWGSHKKNFLISCASYEIPAEIITLMFCMTLSGSALTLLDSNFLINGDNSENVDALFISRFDSVAKQEEVSDELATVRVSDFQKDDENNKDGLAKLFDIITTLIPLSLPSDLSDSMQKIFLKGTLNGTDWALHAEM